MINRILKYLCRGKKPSSVIPNTPIGLAHFAFSSLTWVVTPDSSRLTCEYDELSRVSVVPTATGFHAYYEGPDLSISALDSLDDIVELISEFGQVRRWPRMIEFTSFIARGRVK
jgi:hypothetical protein